MFGVNMKQVTILKGMLVGGIIGIALGMLFIGLGASMPPPVSTVFFVFGAILALFSVLFTLRINKVLKKVAKKSALGKTKALAIALLILTATSMLLNVASAQAGITECIEMWKRIRYVQFIMLGFLIIAGFLAFAPVILGRTILGPILADLQYMAGAMLILLIFALLLVFPLDVMFYIDNPAQPNDCKIDFRRLQSDGPLLLQIILRLLVPPHPPF